MTPGLGAIQRFVALLIAFVIGALFVPNFLTRMNLTAILFQYSIIGLLALGQLLVILTAGIDLSQGSVVALTSIVVAVLMKSTGLLPAVAGGLLAGTSDWRNQRPDRLPHQDSGFCRDPGDAGYRPWPGAADL